MPTYTLTMYAACGMSIPLLDQYDRANHSDARHAAARRLLSLRRDGYPITILDKGERWEIHPPNDYDLIPDDAGILSLRPIKVPTRDCWICGYPIPLGEVCLCDQPCEDDTTEDK